MKKRKLVRIFMGFVFFIPLVMACSGWMIKISLPSAKAAAEREVEPETYLIKARANFYLTGERVRDYNFEQPTANQKDVKVLVNTKPEGEEGTDYIEIGYSNLAGKGTLRQALEGIREKALMAAKERGADVIELTSIERHKYFCKSGSSYCVIQHLIILYVPEEDVKGILLGK